MNIIIDYGLGNLNSVQKGFERVGLETKISSDIEEIRKSNSIILPGVGAFRDAVKLLEEKNLKNLIIEEVNKGKNILGICLGMQLLYDKSFENGEFDGLGLIKGNIKKFDISLKVPHMGWNNLKFQQNNPILKYIKEGDYVYYVHSYYAEGEEEDLIAYSEYEVKVPGIVNRENIYGIQFHPEKSGTVGHNILKAYKEIIS
ncbi:MAG TPA: imidazole glycerol phosphate synthase subunit HisH [Clostridiales bacterium]|jgi:glutamine amidotransferase|nr:imidazole glycerol phosphate synthase subunit HisH [Clostridiales bacterium]